MIEDIPEVHAADLVEDMPSEQAAAIMGELTSNHFVDVPGEMDEDASRAILAPMERKRKTKTFLRFQPAFTRNQR